MPAQNTAPITMVATDISLDSIACAITTLSELKRLLDESTILDALSDTQRSILDRIESTEAELESARAAFTETAGPSATGVLGFIEIS